MFDYRYHEVVKMAEDLARDYSTAKLTERIHTGELVEFGTALGVNIERVRSLALLPAWLVNMSYGLQAAGDLALFDLCGTLLPEAGRQPSREQFIQKRREILEGNKYKIVVHNQEGVGVPVSIEDGAKNFTVLISTPFEPFPRTATTLLYSSLIVGAYTAFESLSTDLWIAAVNLRPNSLAINMLLPQSTPKGEDSASPEKAPSIRLSDLAKYDFNVAAIMGKVLKDRRRANFESLLGIRKAYESAFRLPEDRKHYRTSGELKNLFKGTYSDLRSLESLRNLIVHRGGIIDKKFRDEIESAAPDLYAAREGEALELNGEQVSKYVMAAAQFSSSLLRFVDEWLEKYKE